jgi:hypothetical protein
MRRADGKTNARQWQANGTTDPTMIIKDHAQLRRPNADLRKRDASG